MYAAANATTVVIAEAISGGIVILQIELKTQITMTLRAPAKPAEDAFGVGIRFMVLFVLADTLSLNRSPKRDSRRSVRL